MKSGHLALLPFLSLTLGSTSSAEVVINEVDRHTQEFVTGVNEDALDFIELHNTSDSAASLDGMVLVLYEGLQNKVTDAIDLTGYSVPAKGYFVVGSPGVLNVNLVKQPGPQGKWLQLWAIGGTGIGLFTGARAADFPVGSSMPGSPDSRLKDGVVVTTTSGASSKMISFLTPGQPDAREGGAATVRLNSVARNMDGAPAANPLRNTSAYVASIPTPGRSNNGNAISLPTPSLPDISVVIAPVSGSGFLTAAEKGPAVTGKVTVTRRGPLTSPVTVTLVSSDPSECSVNDTISIPAGSASATKSNVTFTPADDEWKDGAQTVYIRAIPSDSSYQTGTGWLKVTDDDTDTPAAGSLVINEVNGTTWTPGTGGSHDPNGDGVSSSDDDFIEIRNTKTDTAESVSLKGYKLVTSGGEWITFPEEAVLAPGAALVVFSKAADSKIGITTDFGTSMMFHTNGARTIADSRDWISLRDPSGKEVAGHVFEPAQVGSNSRADASPYSFGGESGHGKLLGAATFGRYTSVGAKVDNAVFLQALQPSLSFGRRPGGVYAPSETFSELEADGTLFVRIARNPDASTASDLPVRLLLTPTEGNTVLRAPDATLNYVATIPKNEREVFVALSVIWDEDDNGEAHARPFAASIVAAGHLNTNASANVHDESFTLTPADAEVSKLEERTSVMVSRAFGRTETIPLTFNIIATDEDGAGAEFESGGSSLPFSYTGSASTTVPLRLLPDSDKPDRAFRLDLSGSVNLLRRSSVVTVRNDGFLFAPAAPNPISELEGGMSVKLQRVGGLTRHVTVKVDIAALEGGASTEFAEGAPGTGGATSRTLAFSTEPDMVLPLKLLGDANPVGVDRTFKLTAVSSGGVAMPDSDTVKVLNDGFRFAPATSNPVSELEGAMNVTVQRVAGLTRPVTVKVDIAALAGGASAEFAATAPGAGDATSRTLAFSTEPDMVLPLKLLGDPNPAGVDRTFKLTAVSSGSVTPDSETVTVLNDGFRFAAVAPNPVSELEGGLNVTLQRIVPLTRPVTVTVDIAALTGGVSAEFAAGAPGTGGATSRTLALSSGGETVLPLKLLGDAGPAGVDRTFKLTAVSSGVAMPDSDTVTVLNDGFRFAAVAPNPVSELEGGLNVTLQRIVSLTRPVSVTVDIAALEGGASAEFAEAAPGTGGATSRTLLLSSGAETVLPLKLLGDASPVGIDRTFKLTAVSSGVAMPDSDTVKVLNDGFRFAPVTPNPVSELEGGLNVTLQRVAGLTRPVTVSVGIAALEGGASAEFAEGAPGTGEAASRTLAFSTEAEAVLPLKLLGDANPAGVDRTFKLTAVSSGSMAPDSDTVTVLNDGFRFAPVTPNPVSELEGGMSVTLQRIVPLTRPVTVKVDIAALAGAASAEFAAGAPGTGGPTSRTLALSSGAETVLPLKLLGDPNFVGNDRTFKLTAVSSGVAMPDSDTVKVLNDGFEFQSRAGGVWSELETSASFLMVRPAGVTRPVDVTILLEAFAGGADFDVTAPGTGSSSERTVRLTESSLALPVRIIADALHANGVDRSFSLVATAAGEPFVSPNYTVANDYITVKPQTPRTVASRREDVAVELARPAGRGESVSVVLSLTPETGTLPARFTESDSAEQTMEVGNTGAAALTMIPGTGTDRSFRVTARSNGQTQIESAIITVSDASRKLLDWAAAKELAVGADVPAWLVADGDSDGVPNLLEYAGDSDPKSPASAARPALALSGGKVTVSFTVSGDALTDPDLSLRWDTSPDLNSWTQVAPAAPPAEFKQSLEADTAGPRSFYRVEASILP